MTGVGAVIGDPGVTAGSQGTDPVEYALSIPYLKKQAPTSPAESGSTSPLSEAVFWTTFEESPVVSAGRSSSVGPYTETWPLVSVA